MALFRKEGRTDLIGQFSYAKPNPDTRKWLELFFQEIGLKTLGGQPFDWNRVETRKDKVYYRFRRSPVISVALPSFETDYISEISRKIVSNRPNHLHLPFEKMIQTGSFPFLLMISVLPAT